MRSTRWEQGLLRDARSDYGRLFDGNPQPMWIFDLETLRFLDVNEAAVRSYGYSRAEFRSLTIRDIRPQEDVPRLLGHLPNTRDKLAAGTSLWRHRKKDGSIIDVEITSFWLAFAGRASRVVIANDVTARRQADARARSLLAALVQAERAERERIARELHDDTAQSLTSLLLGLRSLSRVASPQLAHAALSELRDRVAGTLEGVRRIARGLRPAALDGSGLGAALEQLAADLSHAHEIRIDVRVEAGSDEHLPSPIEVALFRVAQEALANAIRHAHAGTVRVELARSERELSLIVADDGRGFELYQNGSGGEQHLGLSGIRERAALLGGTLAVDSAPGRGTTLCVAIPLRGAT